MVTVPISIHDRSHLTVGHDAAEAFRRTIDRARHAEASGYHRFWTAEHHGVPGVADSAPTLVMLALLQATSRIRIGAGGVMIPNHQPLVIAEQVTTLATLYLDRVDLGIGRSLGFLRSIRTALRRESYGIEDLARDLDELLTLLDGRGEVAVMPPPPASLPVFLLATGAGADVAARMGLPLVIGGPQLAVADGDGLLATDRYRAAFRPSRWAPEPMVVLNVTALAAETTAEAVALATSEAWAHVHSKTTGAFGPLEAPAVIATREKTPRQAQRLRETVASTIAGTASDVVDDIGERVLATGADEVLLSGCTFDHAAQLDSDTAIIAAWRERR